MRKNSLLKAVKLSDKEAEFICEFTGHMEDHMPWAYDFFNFSHDEMMELANKIYRLTERYSIVQAQESEYENLEESIAN